MPESPDSTTASTLYDHAGGAEVLERFVGIFYGHVLEDPLLQPLGLVGRLAVKRQPSNASWQTCCSRLGRRHQADQPTATATEGDTTAEAAPAATPVVEL